jgi:RNA polymerase sigma-70 factor (ECF subfamily)
LEQITSAEKFFTEILESYKKLIFKIANSYCPDPEERKDLVQEIVLQLWKAFPKYDKKYALSTWIYRIALNVSISNYRKGKSRKKTEENYKQAVEFTDHGNYRNDQLEKLYKLIDRLNPLEKAIMILYLEGKNHKVMADIMGTSATNISTRINRIKNKLSSNYQTQNK